MIEADSHRKGLMPRHVTTGEDRSWRVSQTDHHPQRAAPVGPDLLFAAIRRARVSQITWIVGIMVLASIAAASLCRRFDRRCAGRAQSSRFAVTFGVECLRRRRGSGGCLGSRQKPAPCGELAEDLAALGAQRVQGCLRIEASRPVPSRWMARFCRRHVS